MYDFVSINLPTSSVPYLLLNPNLNFKYNILDSGEVSTTKNGFINYTSELENLKISFLKKEGLYYHVKLTGSIHRYLHKGTNYNNYNLEHLKRCINELSEVLGIEIDQCKVNSLEYGYNLPLGSINTQHVLKQILFYKGQRLEFKRYSEGDCFRFSKTHYSIKFYDKGLQYNLAESLLRVELKVNKMQFLQSKGVNITRVSDLCSTQILNKIHTELIKACSSIIFAANRTPLTSDFRTIKACSNFMNWQNPLFWSSLESKTLARHKSNYIKALRSHSIATYKPKVIELMDSAFEKAKEGISYPKIVSKNTPLTNERACTISGQDMSEQKEDSKDCSENLSKAVKGYRMKQTNTLLNSQSRNNRTKQKSYLQYSLFPLSVHY